MPKVKDIDGSWYYLNPSSGRKSRLYERICDCGKIDYVIRRDLSRVCTKCNVTGTRNPRYGSHLAHTEETKRRISKKTSMENNPRWKGGRAKEAYGYIIIKMPEHPSAKQNGYVLEHRLVMENELGRYLTEEEIVHHINGDRTDNRPDNLQLMPSVSAHIKHHRRENHVNQKG